MLNLISILFIFVIDSFPQIASKGFLIMPYLAYLSYKKEKKSILFYILVTIILMLHTTNPIYSVIFVLLNAIFYYIYFMQFSYNIENICIFTILQILCWKFFANESMTLISIGYSYIIYFFINYIYMKGANR